jgi:AraC-like DNA-binding protein
MYTSTTPSVAGVLLDPEYENRIRRDLGSAATLRGYRGLSAFVSACAIERDFAAVMIDIYSNTEAVSVHNIARLSRMLAGVPLIAVIPLTNEAVQDVVAIVRAGIGHIVSRDGDGHVQTMRTILQNVAPRLNVSQLLEPLRRKLPLAACEVIAACLSCGKHRPTVDEVAAQCGVHRRTLANWLRTSGLPPAGVLISWGRLLTAAATLERSTKAIEQVAFEMGFESSGGLNNLARRYVGLTPQEMRKIGACARVTDALTSVLCCEGRKSSRDQMPRE